MAWIFIKTHWRFNLSWYFYEKLMKKIKERIWRIFGGIIFMAMARENRDHVTGSSDILAFPPTNSPDVSFQFCLHWNINFSAERFRKWGFFLKKKKERSNAVHACQWVHIQCKDSLRLIPETSIQVLFLSCSLSKLERESATSSVKPNIFRFFFFSFWLDSNKISIWIKFRFNLGQRLRPYSLAGTQIYIYII